MLGLFMVMPVLAVLATDYPDYSAALVGVAIGGYGLTQAILQIPMGMLSDKYGRKPIIVAGLLLFAIGSAVAGMADSLLWVVIGRFLQGAGAIAGAIMALAGDVSRESERAKVMAIIGIAIGFSFYIALLLGPLIANQHGLAGIFMITAILAVVCIPLVIWGVPSAQNYSPSGDTLPNLADLKSLLGNPQLLRLNLSVAFLHMLITLLIVQLPGMLVASGVELAQHWTLYMPILLASIVGLVVLMGMKRRSSVSGLLSFAIVLLIAAFGGFTQAHSTLTLAVLAVVFFTGFNYLEANLPALVSNIAPAGKKGSAMGMYASFQFFGAFCGGVISGLANQYSVPHLVFIGAIVLCLVWLALLFGFDGKDNLKRVTLQVNVSAQRVAELRQKLSALQGVQDITIVPAQQAAYLKVDSQEFEINKAQELANTEHL